MELLPSQDEIEHSLFSSLLEELAEHTEADSRTHEAQLRVTQKEKNGLVTKLTGVCILSSPGEVLYSPLLASPTPDAKAIILQLEGECAALHKSNR